MIECIGWGIITGPNLDLLCIWQSDTAPFCENYAKLYFGTKHLEKGDGVVKYFVPFLVNIKCCPNFRD